MSGAKCSTAVSSGAVARGSSHLSGHANPVGADDWYCRAHNKELGPFSFVELSRLVSQGHLFADHEVKLSRSGKWRRIGSIGRLVALLPFDPPQAQVQRPAVATSKPIATVRPNSSAVTPAVKPSVPTVTPQALPVSLPVASLTVAPVAAHHSAVGAGDLELIKAQAAHEATELAVRRLIAWAFGPQMDRQWWAASGDEQYGPVDFGTIFEWVVSGRLRQTDHVRNGIFGQYGPVANLPGVLSAAAIMKRANESLELAKSRILSKSGS